MTTDNALKDDDGVAHSPTWWLDCWLVLREEYGAQLTRQLGDDATEADHDAHIQDCDEALRNLEAVEARVDKLFGYTKSERLRERGE